MKTLRISDADIYALKSVLFRAMETAEADAALWFDPESLPNRGGDEYMREALERLRVASTLRQQLRRA